MVPGHARREHSRGRLSDRRDLSLARRRALRIEPTVTGSLTARANVRLITPGFESLSTNTLKLMEKGVTAFNYMGSMLTILHKQPERADGHGDREHRRRRVAREVAPAEQVVQRVGKARRQPPGQRRGGEHMLLSCCPRGQLHRVRIVRGCHYCRHA